MELVIRREADFIPVGTADNGLQAMNKIRRLKPDIAVIELDLLKTGNFNLLDLPGFRGIATQILVMAACYEGEDVYRLITSGAKGCLVKREPVEVILRAIRRAFVGKTSLSAGAQTALQNYLRQRAGASPFPAREKQLLSDREIQILQYTAQGVSIVRISNLLHISVSTVKRHRQTLFAKLNVANAPAAVYEGMRRGLL